MEAVEENSLNDSTDASKKKYLIAILIGAVICGFMDGVLPEESEFLSFFEIAFGLFFLIMVISWCFLDSEQRNFTISQRLSVMMFFFLLFFYYNAKTDLNCRDTELKHLRSE